MFTSVRKGCCARNQRARYSSQLSVDWNLFGTFPDKNLINQSRESPSGTSKSESEEGTSKMADLASLVKRLETVAIRLEGIGNSDSRAVVSGKANSHISFNLVLSISLRNRSSSGISVMFTYFAWKTERKCRLQIILALLHRHKLP